MGVIDSTKDFFSSAAQTTIKYGKIGGMLLGGASLIPLYQAADGFRMAHEHKKLSMTAFNTLPEKDPRYDLNNKRRLEPWNEKLTDIFYYTVNRHDMDEYKQFFSTDASKFKDVIKNSNLIIMPNNKPNQASTLLIYDKYACFIADPSMPKKETALALRDALTRYMQQTQSMTYEGTYTVPKNGNVTYKPGKVSANLCAMPDF